MCGGVVGPTPTLRLVRRNVGQPVRNAALVTVAAALAVGVDRLARHPRGWHPGGGTAQPGTLHCRVIGAGAPAVLLLHGLVGSGRYWGADYDALADGTGSVLVPDLLGFGRSTRDRDDFGLDAHAAALEAVLVERGADAPVVVGAHSFGTLVALRLATRRPDLVRSIVAFGTPWYADDATARTSLARMGPLARLFALDEGWSRRVCVQVCEHRRLAAAFAVMTRPDLPAAIAADAVQHTWSSYHGALTALIEADAPALLGEVSAPVHVVVGANDAIPDRVLLAEQSSAGLLASLAIWPGDHDLPLVQRSRAVALLRTALTDDGR